MATYRIRVYRVMQGPRQRRRVYLIVDEEKRTIDWSYTEMVARRKLAALRCEQRKVA